MDELPFSNYMYGVFLAEVEVDTTTGRTRVLKMTLAADAGRIVNKLVVDGQCYGGIAQGIGLALSEDFEDLQKHNTMASCGLPYIQDIPDGIELLYLETPRPLGPHGAAGIGELPLTSPHASIINAIYNACGVCITQLPALPEKVLAGLKAKAGTGPCDGLRSGTPVFPSEGGGLAVPAFAWVDHLGRYVAGGPDSVSRPAPKPSASGPRTSYEEFWQLSAT